MNKMPDRITDGPQTPEDMADFMDIFCSEVTKSVKAERMKHAMSDPMECPYCKDITLYPAYYPMWECSECHREVQF